MKIYGSTKTRIRKKRVGNKIVEEKYCTGIYTLACSNQKRANPKKDKTARRKYKLGQG